MLVVDLQVAWRVQVVSSVARGISQSQRHNHSSLLCDLLWACSVPFLGAPWYIKPQT